MTTKKKIHFVSIIGKTNSGKSSFLNKILNINLSPINKKEQTTRRSIQGILNLKKYQIIFNDNPGLHNKNNLLASKINIHATKNLKENYDLILFFKTVNQEIDEKEMKILEKLDKNNSFIVISKTDLNNNLETKNKILKKFQELNFKNVFFLSNKIATSYLRILNEIKKRCYFSEIPYEENQISDLPLRFLVAEKIRNSINNNCHQEIPYENHVEIVEFDESKKNITKIRAIIWVNKKSQIKIIVGKNGLNIKKIGIEARENIEDFLESKIFLELEVKLDKNWTKNDKKTEKLFH